MSMFGGLGGDSGKSVEPEKAPKVPKRHDEKLDNKVMDYYKRLKEKDAYSTTLLGGSAATPTKSYTATLFGVGSM
jgi:hypothetical protein